MKKLWKMMLAAMLMSLAVCLFAGTAVLVELPGIVAGCGCVSGIVICKHLARYQGERMQVHLLQGSH